MTTLSRRRFLKGAVALGAGAVLYRYAGGWTIVTRAAGPETRQLRLIHTNDHHARIEPASFRIGGTSAAPINRNFGGVARRKTLFDQIRAEAGGAADRLFLDAGDYFQGTLYFNVYNGKADRFFYNRLGYAAGAIGNHEFDKGDQTLADFISGVPIASGQPAEPLRFPLVAANMTAAPASPLAALYQEEIAVTAANAGTEAGAVGKWCKRAIVTMPSGAKIGITGLITVETSNIASPSAAISFDPNYAAVVNAQAAALKAAGCVAVIVLTHIGYEADKLLAPQLRGVSLIIGGHSHTPLLPTVPSGTPQPFGTTSQGPYPTVATDADGKTLPIVQDWQWGLWVGDLTIGLDANGEVTQIVSGTVRPVWADGLGAPPRALLPGEEAEIAPNADFQTAITATFKPGVDALGNAVIGTSAKVLSNANARATENELGNFIADAIRTQVAKFADNTPTIPLVSIINGGGIRANIDAGPITVGEVITVMPFGNTVSRVTVTGAQLKAALENGVSALQPGAALDASRNPVGSGRFPNVSGMRYTVDVRRPAAQAAQAATGTQPAIPARPGQRITSVEILERQQDGTDKYVPLDLAKTYRVATLNFVMNGGDGYEVFAPLRSGATDNSADPSVGRGTGQIDSGLIDADVVQDYIRAQPNGTVDPKLEKRITVIRAQLNLPLIGKNAGIAAQPAVTAGD
jgi:5'-nucleotidase